jgi:hypothetical protein
VKDELPQLYRMCQEDYDAIFTKLARNAVLEIASNWNASNYWLNRTTIGNAMKTNLKE